MRIISAIAILTMASPALAAGRTASSFSPSWKADATTEFAQGDHGPVAHVVAVHAARVSPADVADALSSSGDAEQRRDLAINEIAAGWQPVQRVALENLREAQRAYSKAEGGDGEARGQHFIALLKQVVNENGRSVAHEAPQVGKNEELNSVYDRTLREASDVNLSNIETIETSWIAYRDAFDHFASVMDRPDVARAIDNDLVDLRVKELEADQKR